MDIRHIVRAGAVVMVAALLLTFAFAAAPGGVKAAFAQEAAKTAAPAEGEAKAAEGDAAKAAEGEAAEGEAKAEAAEGEEGGEGEEAEIPHKVGNPTPSQLQDLRNAWAGIPGYDLLIVAILGLVATVGVIGFGAYKQSKV